MLAGKRAARVADQLLREIAGLLAEKVRDPRVKGATLTGVSLSDDLKIAKVHYSVIGERGEVDKTQAGLDSAKGFIKKQIALRMGLRHVPEIAFKYDPSLEKGNEMERIFERLKTHTPNERVE